MDGMRFDHWTKRLADNARSRRGLLRVVLGGGLALSGAVVLVDDALACRKDGRECDPEKKDQCCSGKCKRKRNGQGACKRAPGAFGCTVNKDTCDRDENSGEIPCPDKPEGFCVVLDNGQPFCAESGICFDCKNGEECTREAGGTPGKCITECRACKGQDSRQRACVFAEQIEIIVTRNAQPLGR